MYKILFLYKDKQIPEGGRAGAPSWVLAFWMSQVDVDGAIGVFGTQQHHFVHCKHHP